MKKQWKYLILIFKKEKYEVNMHLLEEKKVKSKKEYKITVQ